MWRQGWSISEIGRSQERQPGSIFGMLAAHGGITPQPQRRSSHALRVDERESISRFIAMGKSMRWIASELGRPASTISREIARNGGRLQYRSLPAEERARGKAARPKQCLHAQRQSLRDTVAEKLQHQWSPEQGAGWLRTTFPTNTTIHVSHETIYKSLFIQTRGVLKKELVQHLRSQRVMRRARNSTSRGQLRGRIIDAVSIRERPAEVEDRAIPGHWEGDLITGTRNTHIATLVERTTRSLYDSC
jgi:IS30 family transposase